MPAKTPALCALLAATLLAGCARGPVTEPVEEAAAPAAAPARKPAPVLENEPDRGERALLAQLQQAAADADSDRVAELVTEHVQLEARALHGGMPQWLATLAGAHLEPGMLYTRDGAGGRMQTATLRNQAGEWNLGFFVIATPEGLRLDNVLSSQAPAPGYSPALAGSRTNVLRAFWAYYGALTGFAPEFLPDRADESPALSPRVRLAAWRSSAAPGLRDRLVQSGPEATRASTPRYLDAMAELLSSYNLPEVREADLEAGTVVVLFSPTDHGREKLGREPFLLRYRSAWQHGMQVLATEELYTGKQ